MSSTLSPSLPAATARTRSTSIKKPAAATESPPASDYTPGRALRHKTVFMMSNGAAEPFKFVSWVRTPRRDGSAQTDELGVGALVYVPWRCGPPFNRRPPQGFTKGHFILRPYWPLYLCAADCYGHRNAIVRPPVSSVRLYRKGD